MKRVALLAAVVFPVVVLFYALHGTSKAAPKSDARDQPPVAVSNTQTMAPSLATTQTDRVEHANVVGLPDALEPGYLAIQHAAKACFEGKTPAPATRPNGPDETIDAIQLKYRQVASNGVGHIEELRVVDGKFTDQSLQDCILKQGASATWRSDAPDGQLGELSQNVTVGDLMRPDFGLPPESKRSPRPTAPPTSELAKPLGSGPNEGDDPPDVERPGTVVVDPGPAHQPK